MQPNGYKNESGCLANGRWRQALMMNDHIKAFCIVISWHVILFCIALQATTVSCNIISFF